MYNGITRDVERELFPVLREFGLRFHGYNPLAGGLLAGKYASINDPALSTGGRFSSKYSGTADNPNPTYRERYIKQALFDALDILSTACTSAGVTMAEASLRWTLHHSALDGKYGDAIIFGASSQTHFDSNMASCMRGRLPAELAEAFNKAWSVSRVSCESYFRGYGSKPGRTDSFMERF